MRKNRTPAECMCKYLSLADELCKYYLPFRKFGDVDFVICADRLGLVINNEILSVADLDTNEIYSVFGRITPYVYSLWASVFMSATNFEFLPQEYFVEIEAPQKLL